MDVRDDLPYRLGVGVVLLNPQGMAFVGRRRDTTIEAWQLPQGGIDADENPYAAALRELQEETGVRPELTTLIAESRDWLTYDLPADLVGVAFKGKYRGQKQKWYVLRFLGEDGDVDLEAHDPEFTAWRWIAPAQLPDMIVPFKRALYQQILDEFGGVLNGEAGRSSA